MAISITRYVDVTSGVGAGSVVPTRDLVARLFTGNILIPPENFISFDSAVGVGNYFGTTSEEYLRSVFYFGFISKSVTQAGSIQFARWVNTDVAPLILALKGNNSAVGNWTTIPDGAFTLTMGSITDTVSGLNFSAVSSLADVATLVQDAINADGSFILTGTTNGTTSVTGFLDTSGLAIGMSVIAADIPFGTTITEINSSSAITISVMASGSNVGENITFNNGLWGNATVTYNSGTGGFDLVGGATGVAAISVAAPLSGTDITPTGLLGWIPESINTNGNVSPGAIWSIGAVAESITDVLSNSSMNSTNFGSFTFLTNLSLSLDQVTEAATWNFAQNNLYLYSVAVQPADASTWSAALTDIGGVGLTLSPTLDPLEYPEMAPMILEAATDYDAVNSVQNYMFQVFNLTPSVTTDTDANFYDSLKINYYGQTQQAGTQIEFYQRGVLQGPPTSPLGMNTYVNEIWLKDVATAAIATLLLAVTEVPANAQGTSMILGTLQNVINQALENGTISVNKELTTTQQMYITSVTGDPTAWHQVQDIGYWVNCTIVQVGPDYEAHYILVYSKNDVINFVSGTHILI